MLWKMTLLHLKTMLKKTPIQFLLIILTQIFAVLCILLAYGISQNIFQKQEQEIEYAHRCFEVSLTSWEEQQGGSWMPLHPVSIDEINTKLSDFLPHIEDALSYYAVAGRVQLDGTSYSIGGIDLPNAADDTSETSIAYSDYENGNHVVQVAYRDYPCAVGDMIRIGGEGYEVVDTDEESAIGSYIYTFFMPYRAFPKSAEITTLSFVLKDVPTEERAEELAILMQQYFGMETQVELPVIPDLAEQQFNRLAVLICAVIAFLVILNVSMVYLYTLRQRKQMLGIYCLCGCTPSKALAMFACEWLLLLSLCYGGAWLLFSRGILPGLSGFLSGLDGFYSGIVYLSIYGLYVLFSVCLLLLGCRPLFRSDTPVLVKEVG